MLKMLLAEDIQCCRARKVACRRSLSASLADAHGRRRKASGGRKGRWRRSITLLWAHLLAALSPLARVLIDRHWVKRDSIPSSRRDVRVAGSQRRDAFLRKGPGNNLLAALSLLHLLFLLQQAVICEHRLNLICKQAEIRVLRDERRDLATCCA